MIPKKSPSRLKNNNENYNYDHREPTNSSPIRHDNE